MLVDSTTLSDLEVFQDSAGKGGLFALLDRTDTKVGRVTLRQRFERPHSDAPSIRRTQDAVRFFLGHPDVLHISDGSIKDLRRYLDTNVVLSSSTGVLSEALAARWFAMRYSGPYRELREGVLSTLSLLRTSIECARSILSLDPPSEVRVLAADLVAASERCFQPEGRGAPKDICRLDRFFRGTGRESLTRIVECIGELDALRSMARATQRLDWTMPEVVDSAQFLFEGDAMVHPFVDAPVSNPVRLSGGEPMVFLTGPNMAGKTTYLRTAAIVVFLAQVGMGVPARRVRLTPVEVLLSSLNPADNLRLGLSFFFSEVLRVQEAAKHLVEGRRCFVVFDEVFKGTNVKDALDASEAVILGFARAGSSGFIFSSHLVELAEVLRSDPHIRFHYFDGRLISGKAHYSYRIQDGISEQRLGLQLLAEARIPELIAQIGV